MDDQGVARGTSWPTLTEAAARSGYTREALRKRVRRGKLRAIRGNDGVTRIDPAGLEDLPPPELSGVDGQGRPGDGAEALAKDGHPDVLPLAVDGLRTALDRALDDLGQARTALDEAHALSLAVHGQAARAEAALEAANARVAELQAELAEARTPWLVRVARGVAKAVRRPGS